MNVEKICFIKYMKYSLGANIQKEKLKIKAINTVSMINTKDTNIDLQQRESENKLLESLDPQCLIKTKDLSILCLTICQEFIIKYPNLHKKGCINPTMQLQLSYTKY